MPPAVTNLLGAFYFTSPHIPFPLTPTNFPFATSPEPISNLHRSYSGSTVAPQWLHTIR